MSELKDYSILDIEAIDDERFKKEKAPGKWVTESRVYLKSEADKVIAELEEKHKKEVEQLLIEIVKLKKEIESMKVKFRKFNDNVCKKIVDASRTMSTISQDAQMDFYEEFIKDAK